MVNDSWVIRWKDYLTESYSHGSIIEFLNDRSVKYENRLMPPGMVIHKWYSKTNFQMDRLEPSLPLIDGESAYQIILNADYPQDNRDGLMLRISFYGRYDEIEKSIIIREDKATFKPPITTYSYTIELINGGAENFTFHTLILKEISREEFDEDQKRIEEAKKNKKKHKKAGRTNKKSQ